MLCKNGLASRFEGAYTLEFFFFRSVDDCSPARVSCSRFFFVFFLCYHQRKRVPDIALPVSPFGGCFLLAGFHATRAIHPGTPHFFGRSPQLPSRLLCLSTVATRWLKCGTDGTILTSAPFDFQDTLSASDWFCVLWGSVKCMATSVLFLLQSSPGLAGFDGLAP